ncbi:MAG: hypothetical protein A2745_02690 [Candidatus Harrisonbacteria bacterium RIFCSPHIGHO2_01_FULL_44_13]|uniref:Peptidase S8/S53 domain-containing protein n=1 Tax=Candidatus Harrisonbacteria bacterium RIFCSPLOWO2_01_FULL_44_18 TaxID=1798407 RepID=A0A1G1ZNM4_9BACT|nr:MAG: hypothetical protein A2745_02690 [Candidatus Harrisonbacteria bacterium RIFCSPHIGHO2_01_FULL_44_13]OGY66029.1 MAG: hypothetical protein A3A16_01285 [Candidatus Harrisonbacteria bacterium RIFCSPLOWO2_01_FULL_44_18]
MNSKKSLIASGLVSLALLAGVALVMAKDSSQRKIVVFDPTLNEAARDELLAAHGAVKVKDLSLINASVVLLPSKVNENALLQRPGVLRVDEDVTVYALAKPAPAPQPSQVMPWGIDRVDAEMVWPSDNNADPVRVAVVDTGISASHPDLVDNIKGGHNAINPAKSWNDDNGHGSHVAGTVGALNNAVGVVGVGPLVDLYAVKVLNRNGSGFLSDVIEGIQWSVANGMQVVNMSLGTSSDVQSMHDAVAAAYNAGVVVVAAAGNSGDAVGYPAAYPEVIAVSATDSSDNLASFSSRGPEVDLAAPGVSVYSTYKGTGYATLSGTSMAAPHVTGSAALVLNTPVGAYDANGNGVWDPSEVQQKLQDRAVDLGDLGYDNLYGWGLVNAYNAVQP